MGLGLGKRRDECHMPIVLIYQAWYDTPYQLETSGPPNPGWANYKHMLLGME